jgi:hypothetical protein
MIKQYRKVIEHEIRIDESALAELIDHAKQTLREEGATLDAETIFEEVYFNSDEGIEIFIDNDEYPYSVNQVEMYYSDDVYDFVYNMIYDYVTEYVKKGE